MEKQDPFSTVAIPDEVLMNKIYLIRGQKVCLTETLQNCMMLKPGF